MCVDSTNALFSHYLAVTLIDIQVWDRVVLQL